MFCRNCGSELNDDAVFCPNCGVQTTGGNPNNANNPNNIKSFNASAVSGAPAPMPAPMQQPGYVQQPQPSGTNGLGIAGFVLGLLSLGLGFYFCITPIIALVLSIVGVVKMKNYQSCNALAIVGLVLSIIATIIWGLVWIIVGGVIFATGF